MRSSRASGLLQETQGFDTGRLFSGELAVADINGIGWSSDVLECLTILEENEEALMALAKSRGPGASTACFDDFICRKRPTYCYRKVRGFCTA